MILKTSKRTLEIKLKLSKVERFEAENCKDEESLLTLVPSKVMAKDRISFLARFLNFFQIDDGEKLSIEEIYDFLDEYLDENECDVMSIYTDIIKEMDVKGVINKNMGFTITKMLNQRISEIKEKMENSTLQSLPAKENVELG